MGIFLSGAVSLPPLTPVATPPNARNPVATPLIGAVIILTAGGRVAPTPAAAVPKPVANRPYDLMPQSVVALDAPLVAPVIALAPSTPNF